MARPPRSAGARACRGHRARRRALLVAVAQADRTGARPDARDGARRRRPVRRRHPRGARQRRDLAADGAVPGDGGEALRGGAAKALVPHVRVARATDAADRDSRPRRGAARRHRHRSGTRRRPRSRSSRPRPTASNGSSETCSTSRSSRRTGSPSGTKRSTWVASSTRRSARSPRRRGGARSTTGSPPKRRRRSSSRTATACYRSSRTCSRTPFDGRPTAAASTSSCGQRTGR